MYAKMTYYSEETYKYVSLIKPLQALSGPTAKMLKHLRIKDNQIYMKGDNHP